jgi:hypothetical protein
MFFGELAKRISICPQRLKPQLFLLGTDGLKAVPFKWLASDVGLRRRDCDDLYTKVVEVRLPILSPASRPTLAARLQY